MVVVVVQCCRVSKIRRSIQLDMVSHQAVRSVLDAAPGLQSLNIRDCRELFQGGQSTEGHTEGVAGSAGLAHPTLRNLEVSFCNIDDAALLETLLGCPCLTTLRADVCKKLSAPVVAHSALEELHILAGHRISVLELRCPALRLLNVRSNWRTGAVFQELVVEAPGLHEARVDPGMAAAVRAAAPECLIECEGMGGRHDPANDGALRPLDVQQQHHGGAVGLWDGIPHGSAGSLRRTGRDRQHTGAASDAEPQQTVIAPQPALVPDEAAAVAAIEELEGQLAKLEAEMSAAGISQATKYGLKRQRAILEAKLKKARSAVGAGRVS